MKAQQCRLRARLSNQQLDNLSQQLKTDKIPYNFLLFELAKLGHADSYSIITVCRLRQ